MAKKVQSLKTDYYYQQELSQHAQMQYAAQRRKFRLFAWGLTGLVVLITLVCCVRIISAHSQVGQLHQKTTVLKKSVAKQKTTNANLRSEVKLLKNTTYLQQLARQKYYYSKSGETVYSLPSDKTQGVTAR